MAGTMTGQNREYVRTLCPLLLERSYTMYPGIIDGAGGGGGEEKREDNCTNRRDFITQSNSSIDQNLSFFVVLSLINSHLYVQ